MAIFVTSPVLIATCAVLALWLLHKVWLWFDYRLALKRNGCGEPPRYPHKDPIFGLDLFMQYMNGFKSGDFLDTNKRHYETYGKTFKANLFGTTFIKTIDPEVSKSFHSTSFNKFGLQPLRYEVSKNLFGNGIIVVDGPHWQHGRALIRSSFDIVHIANFEQLGRHVRHFLDLLPRDGSTIDLLPLFKRLILDTTSEFIFGESMNALSSPESSKDFMDAFAYAQRGTGIRAMLGRFKFLHRDKEWWKACKTVTDFADRHVEKAIARVEKGEVAGKDSNYLRLVDEMAKDTQDRLTLRSHILSVFSPAHDGAAIALSNITFTDCFSLAHRITPIATMNQRQCLESTVLPLGGGKAGQSPLYIQKGNIVEVNYRCMQLSKELWGGGAEEFRPERWQDIRPTWEYTPFGGGPRICPGLRLVYTESGYVTVMLLREFESLENRDPELQWKEEMRLTAQSKNGTLVGLVPENKSL
ncbi:cytochrome P450 [Glonium stellatum]|uniref:Cytochrome P450 n=1 Tax=Glonium stellatum TaxID=574774 RepID=A0A8E2FCH8_9PEZI|nr:cytochrome P450 [Glonium stellatum]